MAFGSTPYVLGGIQKSSSRVFARDLRFRDFFGISGIFVATALLAQVVLAVILGFHAEAAKISKVQVVCLHCIAVYAAFHLFNSAVYWRTLVEGLFDVQEGNVDPLEALNKIPPAKRLMKWYYDNFAVHTGGRYSLLLVIGAEVFEIVVQFTNANSMAGYLDWPALSFYGTLVSTNCIMFGICMLSDERFVSPPVVITVDVVMDATYVMFNVFYISPTSYWAIIVPLLLSVDMLNDSMTLHAHESVKHALFKQSTRKKNDESKANGTFEHDVIVDFAKRLNAGAENNRKESVGGVNSTALELVDLRENEIVELPYEMMDVKGEGLRLLFDGNPCAEEVDWSGLGKDRLPARMGVGYDNGGFGGNLRVLKLGRNTLDESVFEELAAANFTRIEELDVSWNALGGIGEEVRGLKKLRRLDVSGNTGVGARDLVAAPEDLEILNASFCGVDDITGEQAVELQDRNMVLHGNPVTEITWAYQNQLTKIPAWLRVLEKVKKADLGYCDIKEMKGGAFPASLEELNIQNQLVGLRLHPDSFEGLSKLRRFEASTCFLTEDDMHPGLFGDTKLERLDIMGNVDMLNFNAAALFPGSSGQQLEYLHLENCGLTGIGG
ncbi:hypothetical protein TeGR_g5044, partial [Tetraparma gracilis]